MSALDAFGWFCAIVGVVSLLPQVVRLLRAETSAGVSLLNWQLVAGSAAAWTVHGVQAHRPNIWAANGLVALLAWVITVLVVRDRRLSPLAVVLIPALVMAACVGVDLTMGAAVFGLAVASPQLVGGLAQLRDTLTSRNLSGISFGYLALNLLVQANWLTWSLFAHERSVTMAGSSMGLVCLLNVIAYLARRAGVPPMGRPPLDAGPEADQPSA